MIYDICIYIYTPQSVGLSKPFPAEAFGMAGGNQRFDAVRGGHFCCEGVQQVARQGLLGLLVMPGLG